jgi:hypothetical protein
MFPQSTNRMPIISNFILKVIYLVMKPVQRKIEETRELPWTEFGQVSEVAAVHDLLYRLSQ